MKCPLGSVRNTICALPPINLRAAWMNYWWNVGLSTARSYNWAPIYLRSMLGAGITSFIVSHWSLVEFNNTRYRQGLKQLHCISFHCDMQDWVLSVSQNSSRNIIICMEIIKVISCKIYQLILLILSSNWLKFILTRCVIIKLQSVRAD